MKCQACLGTAGIASETILAPLSALGRLCLYERLYWAHPGQQFPKNPDHHAFYNSK
jgi:hypothetical protein